MIRLAEILAALTLLTRLPLGGLTGALPAADPARAVWAYPLAGALVGLIAGLVYWLLAALGVPPLLAAAWALAAMTLLTGAFHDDGLADVADGFGGGAVRARKLEIMRDSRIGTFGVVALVAGFAIRVFALAALAGPVIALAALISTGALSRAGMAALMWLMPHARSDGLSAGVGRPADAPALEALALGALAALLVLPFWAALVAILAAGIAVAVTGLIAHRQIGGQTGDVLGAAGIAAECAALTAIAAVLA